MVLGVQSCYALNPEYVLSSYCVSTQIEQENNDICPCQTLVFVLIMMRITHLLIVTKERLLLNKMYTARKHFLDQVDFSHALYYHNKLQP